MKIIKTLKIKISPIVAFILVVAFGIFAVYVMNEVFKTYS